MSKTTLHEVYGTIVKVTDGRYVNTFFKPDQPVSSSNNPFYGDVSIHMITPAVDDEQHYCPAQETFFYGASARELRDLLVKVLAEPSSSVTEPDKK